MDEKLWKLFESQEEMLPVFKIELLRMNERFSSFRKIATKYNTEKLTYEMDEFDGMYYIMMEGTIPLGDNPKLTLVRTFEMLAEMQYEEDLSETQKVFQVGNPIYIVRKDVDVAYFRVDLPFSDRLIKTIGTNEFFAEFLIIISEG